MAGVTIATKGIIRDTTSTTIKNLFPVDIIVNGIDGFPRLKTFREDTPTFQFTIKNVDGTAFSLAAPGSEVRFTGKRTLADAEGTEVFSGICTLDAPLTAGVCTSEALTQDETNFTGTRPLVLQVELEYNDTATTAQTLGQSELIIFPDNFQTT